MAALAAPNARFHVPGHKGNAAAIAPFGNILPLDLTEIPGADNLQCPSGSLAASEANMSRAFGSGATLYSAAGATSCIGAMLALFLRPGASVVMARNCHVSAVRALAFLDATPLWVLPENGRITPSSVEAALAAGTAKTVYITSPTYYGHISDIAGIAAVCKRHGATLLVDNAHGAHLHFLSPSIHPLALGADATADSAHKTLPCLTPAALLHLRDAQLAVRAREMLNFFSSTSPSYLVLESLDLAAGLLLDAPPDFSAAAARLAAAASAAPHLLADSDDPLKLCLRPAQGGWPAAQVDAALAAAGIQPELSDGTHIVLMASPYNRPSDFTLLHHTLQVFYQKPPLSCQDIMYFLPQIDLPVRQALFAEKQRIPTAEAVGRTAAGLAAPCPPALPLVMPGEVITADIAHSLVAGGIFALDVLK